MGVDDDDDGDIHDNYKMMMMFKVESDLTNFFAFTDTSEHYSFCPPSI